MHSVFIMSIFFRNFYEFAFLQQFKYSDVRHNCLTKTHKMRKKRVRQVISKIRFILKLHCFYVKKFVENVLRILALNYTAHCEQNVSRTTNDQKMLSFKVEGINLYIPSRSLKKSTLCIFSCFVGFFNVQHELSNLN